MNENELCDAIRERLRSLTELTQLESDLGDGNFVPPQIIDGYLPPKRSQKNDEGELLPEFPFIIVRPSSGQTGNDSMSRATVKILIGCYSEEFDGYKYCLMLLSVIRRGLVEKPTIDGTPFCMELPFEWQNPDEQPWPEWQVEITTQWTVPTPLNIESSEELNHGY